MTTPKIYRLRDQVDKYPGFLQLFENIEFNPDRWKEHISMRCIMRGPVPFNGEYKPVPLQFNNEGKRKKFVLSDICLNMDPFVIFSEKARKALEAFLSPVGEFLEVIAPVPGYIGYRVLVQIDNCVDLEKSDYTKYDNGNIWVRKPTMYEAKVRGQHIFAIPEAPTDLFVSEDFKEAVTLAKLKGFDFSKEIPLV